MSKKKLSGNLYRELVEMQDKMSRLVESTLQPQMDAGAVFGQAPYAPKCDIYETEDAIVLELELPGVKSEEVDVTLEDSQLRITGSRPMEGGSGEYLQMERPTGPFVRTFELPEWVDPDAIEASYQLGILSVRLAKKKIRGQKIKVKKA